MAANAASPSGVEMLPLQYTPEPLQNIMLQAPGGGYSEWEIANPMTGERVVLPRPVGAWTAVQHDGGGWVFIDDERSALVDEDLFKKIMLRNQQNELCVGYRFKSGKWVVHRMRDLMTHYKSARVTVKIGPTRATDILEVAVLRQPRYGGCFIFWHLGKFYHLFGMTAYGGLPSKWINRGKEDWSKLLADRMRLPSQFIGSTHFKIDDKQDELNANAFLLSPAMSTAAILFCLVTWGRCSAQAHGFRSQRSREACQAVFQSIVSGGLTKATRAWIKVVVDEGFVNPWPGTVRVEHCALRVDGDMIDLGPLITSSALGKKIAGIVKTLGCTAENPAMPVHTFLERLVTAGQAPWSLVQTGFLGVAKLVERNIYKVASLGPLGGAPRHPPLSPPSPFCAGFRQLQKSPSPLWPRGCRCFSRGCGLVCFCGCATARSTPHHQLTHLPPFTGFPKTGTARP